MNIDKIEEMNSSIDEIIFKAREKEEEFMFETILPFCSNIVRKELRKEDLVKALEALQEIDKVKRERDAALKYLKEEAPCECCIHNDKGNDELYDKCVRNYKMCWKWIGV